MTTATETRPTTTTNAVFADYNKNDARLEAMHAELDQAVRDLRSSEGWVRWLEFASQCRTYSFNNSLLILLQRPNATLVGGAGNFWRDQRNRWVKKGERGIWILAPLIRKRTQAELDRNPTLSPTVCWGFKPVVVFDVEQTDGEPLPQDPTRIERLEGEAPLFMQEAVVTLVKEQNFTYALGTPDRGSNGTTFADRKHVLVRSGMNQAQTVKTGVHELAHVMLHCNDDDEYLGCRSDLEVEAESVAFLVCGHFGLRTDGYSFGYVAAWAGTDVTAVRRSGERVMKCAKKIIERMEKVARA